MLRPGGRWASLDTTRPAPGLFSPLIRFHMDRVIPALGALVTGQRDAYTYLPASSQNFLPAEQLLECLRRAGFRQAGFRRRMFGTVAVHWAVR